jgi:uncharacterized membrane protein
MQQFGILVWWLLISVIGLAAAPLTWRIFKNLPDRGYAFSKPVGLLFVGLVSWLLGFVHFSTLTILLALGLLAGLSYWIWKNHEAEIRAWVAQNAGYLLVAEGFFLLLFMLFVLFRMFNPDIIGTEKFMDLAFMNSLSRAASFPPFDPWMAGQAFSISYYYFGYLFMAVMLKLSAVPPAVGFNLALGLLFALAGFSVFGLIYNLTRRLSVAAAGWGAVFMLGNLDGVKQVLVTKTMENFNWWTPSRVIPDTINEFPFFSFLLGDMHPHMLAIPFVITALALALNHLKSDDPDLGWQHGDNAAVFTFWGVVIGALGFLNSWDLPTLFFVAMLVFFFQQFRLRGALAALPWKDMGLGLGLILAAAVIPYLPFYLNFHSQAKGLGVTTQNTQVTDYLLIFGTWVFMALTFLAARYHAWFAAFVRPAGVPAPAAKKSSWTCPSCGNSVRAGKRFCGNCGAPLPLAETASADSSLALSLSLVPAGVKQGFLFLLQPAAALRRGLGRTSALAGVLLLAVLATALVFKSPFLALTVLLLAACVPLLAARVDKPETVFALCLLGTAWLLSFGADVLHINDTFQPPLDRMNTVFKFYYQVWFLLGVAGVYGVWWAFQYSFKNKNLRMAWIVPMALLVVGALVYPYQAVLVKTNNFATVPTLDGSLYLNNTFPADREGIEWLRGHAHGTPVVLEATGGEYTDFARVSTFTGLPTVLGWAGHELQWRGNYDEPAKRLPDIDTLYTSQDLGRVQDLVAQYKIEYVFVGTLERQKYPLPGLMKFGGFMDKVYENPGGVVIFKKR